ncbi:hypothetical protein [Aminirod propionatiphilus]|uniref:Uncharacterized protein n=1 Tax=Aminirod propionatiphilus TaxID=3415223 RepID=A0ACD1DUF4_9BACT|nr:hypothetical protein KIH16_11305 [Synergistota bacterium]
MNDGRVEGNVKDGIFNGTEETSDERAIDLAADGLAVIDPPHESLVSELAALVPSQTEELQ